MHKLIKLFFIFHGLLVPILATCPDSPTYPSGVIPSTSPFQITPTTAGMTNFPGSTRQITIMGTVTANEACSSVFNLFSLTVTPSSDTEKEVLTLYIDCTALNYKVKGDWATGSYKKLYTTAADVNSVSFIVSIDLAANEFKNEVETPKEASGTLGTGTTQSWSFDSTTKINVCSEKGGANPISCTISDFKIDYSYLGTGVTWIIGYVGGSTPSLVAAYPFADGSLANSLSSSTSDSGYFGDSLTSPTTGTSPSWDSSNTFVQLTQQGQFLTFPLPVLQAMTATTAYTLGVTAWIKIPTAPTSEGTIFSTHSSDGTETGYKLTVKSSKKLNFYIGSSAATTSSTFPSITEGSWQLIGFSMNNRADSQTAIGTLWIDSTSAQVYRYNAATGINTATILRIGGATNSFVGDISTTRTEGGRQFCDFPCGSSTKYLYWNGTCKSSCSSPFVSSTEQDMDYCNFKCSNNQYLYYNGSCLDGCDSSDFESWVVNDVEKYCYQKSVTTYEEDCTGSFYYWNNTCGDDCQAPLVQKTIGTQEWCLYPCFTNQFLYSDSRCLDTCDSPFVVREELGYKYCDYSCDSKEYAYWNGSCLSTCDSPYRSQTTTYGLSCLLPCESSDLFYHESTRECTEECSAPGTSEDDAYAICLVSETVVSDGSAIDIFVQGPDTPGTPSFASIPYLLQYARFLDIQMPKRLKNLVMSQGRNIITLRFGQYMPDGMIATYSDSSIPEVFKNRNMHSEFVVNFWSELTSWAVIAIVILLLGILESVCVLAKRWKNAELIFNKLKVLARWNLPLVMLASSVGDIVFYTILELISLGKTSAVSVELCLVMTGLLIALIIAGCYLVPIFAIEKRKIILHNDTKGSQDFLKKWENCQVLFRGFRDHVSPNGHFYGLYMARIAIPMFIAAIASKSPIFQTCFYVVFSVMVLGYIIWKKPVNRKINHIQLIIVETLILVINFALLLLVIMNITNSQRSSTFTTAGDIVVYGSLLFNILVVIFLIAKLVNVIFAIKNYRGTKDKSIWIQLFAVYLQQGGMGFEEIFVDEKAAEIFNQRQYVLEDEKTLIESERKKIQEAKKNALLNNDEQSPMLNNSPRNPERLATFMKRSSQIEEEVIQEKEQKQYETTLKPQRIDMHGKEKLLNDTAFEPGQLEENTQSSPNQRVKDVVSSQFNLNIE